MEHSAKSRKCNFDARSKRFFRVEIHNEVECFLSQFYEKEISFEKEKRNYL